MSLDWIDVREQLPRPLDDVLVTRNMDPVNRFHDIAYLDPMGRWHISGQLEHEPPIRNVSHWRPLPALPEEGRQ